MMKSIASEDYDKLVKLIIRYRDNSGLTQTQLADALQETQSFISKIERAERRIDVIELNYICSALGIKLSDFCKELEVEISGGDHAFR